MLRTTVRPEIDRVHHRRVLRIGDPQQLPLTAVALLTSAGAERMRREDPADNLMARDHH